MVSTAFIVVVALTSFALASAVAITQFIADKKKVLLTLCLFVAILGLLLEMDHLMRFNDFGILWAGLNDRVKGDEFSSSSQVAKLESRIDDLQSTIQNLNDKIDDFGEQLGGIDTGALREKYPLETAPTAVPAGTIVGPISGTISWQDDYGVAVYGPIATRQRFSLEFRDSESEGAMKRFDIVPQFGDVVHSDGSYRVAFKARGVPALSTLEVDAPTNFPQHAIISVMIDGDPLHKSFSNSVIIARTFISH